MSGKCTESSRYRMRSRAPSSILSNLNSRSRRRVHLGARMPTMLIWRVSFIPTRTPSPSCARALNFFRRRLRKTPSLVERGLESRKRGCGWPMPTYHRLKRIRKCATPQFVLWNSTTRRPQRTSKIDPASLWVSNFACELYRYFGLYDEATAAGERALQLDPTFAHYGEPALAALYREMGRFDDAIALYEKTREFTGRPGFGLAITYARMNRREEALETLNAAIAGWGYRAGDAIAHVHVTLGAHDDAIRELERACEQRSSSLHGVGIAPEFVPLRSDKRFRSILQRIGLEPEKIFAATRAS